MKKEDTDLQDIYRSADASCEESAPANQLSEQIAREIRKQYVFNLSAGLLGFALLAVLAAALVSDYWPKPEEIVSIGTKNPYIASYTLPLEEQWAVEYRQVAFQADSSELPGPKPLSSKWVKNTAYHIIMGEQALRLNDAGVAQDHLEAAINTFPSMTGLRRYLGEVYLKKQFFEEAAEQLQKALEEGRSADVLNNLGVAYIAVEKYDLAEGLLREALLEKPDCAGFYKNLAQLYQKSGNSNETVAAFEQYLSLNPQDTRQLENYVSYLTAAGKLRDAAVFLDRVEGADPLAVSLLLAKTAAQDNDAEIAVRALRETARLRTPRQTIAEMHDPVFDKIARTEPFETLIYQLELAAVSLSTNLNASGGNGH
jgi:predicted Zn-dependent protease